MNGSYAKANEYDSAQAQFARFLRQSDTDKAMVERDEKEQLRTKEKTEAKRKKKIEMGEPVDAEEEATEVVDPVKEAAVPEQSEECQAMTAKLKQRELEKAMVNR